MRIPVFEEIIIKSLDPLKLGQKIKNSKIGSIPCYISLHQYSSSDTEKIIDHITSAPMIKLIPVQDAYAHEPKTVKNIPENNRLR